MPSIVQSLVIVFARLIIIFPSEILTFLYEYQVPIISKTGINGGVKRGLKVVMDKWLLHQPCFKGIYFKNISIQALISLYNQKQKLIEELMVIGFNPSHSSNSIGNSKLN